MNLSYAEIEEITNKANKFIKQNQIHKAHRLDAKLPDVPYTVPEKFADDALRQSIYHGFLKRIYWLNMLLLHKAEGESLKTRLFAETTASSNEIEQALELVKLLQDEPEIYRLQMQNSKNLKLDVEGLPLDAFRYFTAEQKYRLEKRLIIEEDNNEFYLHKGIVSARLENLKVGEKRYIEMQRQAMSRC